MGATVRQFTATELAPESAYIFRLSAKTRQGWGEPLEATVITTEKRGKLPDPDLTVDGRTHSCLVSAQKPGPDMKLDRLFFKYMWQRCVYVLRRIHVHICGSQSRVPSSNIPHLVF